MVGCCEQRRHSFSMQMRRAQSFVMQGLVVAALLLWVCGTAHALIVGPTPGVIPNTAAAPADDPGFLNAAKTSSSLNAVYLGDGWILSAKHTGITPVTFDHTA